MCADFNTFDGRPAKLAAYFEFCRSIENNIDRRYQANRFNLSILTALWVSLGYLLTSQSAISLNDSVKVATAINAVWFVISIIWFFQILRFREVSRIKHKIATELELELGISVYVREEAALARSSSIIEYTQIEGMLPVLSGIIAVIYFFWFGT
jgi:hypothetical protein